MSFERVPTGAKVPDEFNVIIEIPMNADPVKYEVDKESGALFVDRILHNLSLLFERSFDTVQDLNRYRKEAVARLAPQSAESA